MVGKKKPKSTHRVLNKSFKWNVPIGNQHAIFYTLKDCHRNLRNTHCVYKLSTLGSAWLNVPLLFAYKFQCIWLFSLVFFFSLYILYQALLSADEKLKRICNVAMPRIIGMSFVNWVLKIYSSALSLYLTLRLAEPGICSQPILWKTSNFPN